MRLYLFLLVCVTLLQSVVGCKGSNDSPGGDAAIDAQLQTDFNSGQEAQTWLRSPNHGLYNNEKAVAQKMVQDLLAMGATQVKATDILEMGENTVAEALVVELPADAAKRKSIFAWNAARLSKVALSSEPDTGQKLLRLTFDR